MKTADVESVIRNWALRTPHIDSLVLFGSQARGGGDAHSDWDLHVIARQLGFLADKSWAEEIGLGVPQVYALRDSVLGSVGRVTVIWPVAEIDFVVLSSAKMTLARLVIATALHRRFPSLQRKLGDMALVLRPGYRFIKGERRWGKLYRRVSTEVPGPRMGSADIHRCADLFVADYVWVKHKIERGEFLAAQRILHRSLAERNFALIAELRSRKGLEAWPEARRAEAWATAEDYAGLRIAAQPTATELGEALENSAVLFRRLMADLEGGSWRWPLSSG